MGDSNKCYKCGKGGHWARACTAKRELSSYVPGKQESIKNKVTRCFVCRKLGHLARECPSSDGKYYEMDRPMIEISRRNQEPPPPPNLSMDNPPHGDIDRTAITQAFDSIEEHEWDFIKNESQKDVAGELKHSSGSKSGNSIPREESKYYKVLFMGNKKFNGFLDTCSEKCLIKYSVAKRAHLNVQLDDTDVMLNSPTFKSKIISIGRAVTAVTIDAVEVPNVEMFVVSDDVLNIDVVIGRSWLDHPRVMILKMDNYLYVADTSLHPFDKFQSILTSLDIKPPNRKGAPEICLDAVTSSDEDIGKSSKIGNSKKRRHNSKYDYMDIEEPVARKPALDISYGRERSRDIGRGRSRSRERVREIVRDDRMPKLVDRGRRSRERSRDRYMGRHKARH